MLAFKPLRKPQLCGAGASARGSVLLPSLRHILPRHIENYFPGLPVCRLHGIHNAGSRFRRNREPIHQHKHRLIEPHIQQRLRRGELEHLPGLIQPVKAALAQLEEAGLYLISQAGIFRRALFLCLPFARRLLARLLRHRFQPSQRKNHLHPRPGSQGENRVRHFVNRILLHLAPAVRAIGPSDARKQQPQIVINLGRRGHCRPRIPRRILLPDCHCRGNPVDRVRVRLLYAFQELPRICRERLYIPPLPLRINRVEGKRGFPRSRYAGYHRQRIVGDLKINVFEVMNPRAMNNNTVCRHQIRHRYPRAGTAGSSQRRP